LPSDLTDAEWFLPEPFSSPPLHVDRPRKWPLRQIVEAILYLLRHVRHWLVACNFTKQLKALRFKTAYDTPPSQARTKHLKPIARMRTYRFQNRLAEIEQRQVKLGQKRDQADKKLPR
jgi:hypothetical protein